MILCRVLLSCFGMYEILREHRRYVCVEIKYENETCYELESLGVEQMLPPKKNTLLIQNLTILRLINEINNRFFSEDYIILPTIYL